MTETCGILIGDDVCGRTAVGRLSVDVGDMSYYENARISVGICKLHLRQAMPNWTDAPTLETTDAPLLETTALIPRTQSK